MGYGIALMPAMSTEYVGWLPKTLPPGEPWRDQIHRDWKVIGVSRVLNSRCLSATEEPGEHHDWRIGAGMPSPV